MRILKKIWAAFVLAASLANPALSEEVCQASDCPKTLLRWSNAAAFEDAAESGSDTIVTDRPDFTEASSTVGLGTVQLEFGYTFTHNDDDGVEVDTHAYGEQLWRIGIFAEWLELRVGWAYLSETVDSNGIRDTVDGGDDLYLGFKIALTEQSGCLPEMALIPQAFVPSGADAFSSDEFLPGVNWIYAWELSECVSFAGSTQFNRIVDTTGHAYTEYAQSFTTAASLTDQWGGYLEWFGLFPHSAVERGVGAEHFLNGGFTYLVNDDLQLDIRAGFGLNSRADDFFAGAGFSKRW